MRGVVETTLDRHNSAYNCLQDLSLMKRSKLGEEQTACYARALLPLTQSSPLSNIVIYSPKQTLIRYFGLLYPKSVAYGSLSGKSVRNSLIYIGLFIVQRKTLERVMSHKACFARACKVR